MNFKNVYNGAITNCYTVNSVKIMCNKTSCASYKRKNYLTINHIKEQWLICYDNH